jgi:hypothetical protein
MNYIDNSIDLSKFHLFKKNKSLLSDTTIQNLKKIIKTNVQAPKANTKVYVVNFSVDDKKEKPFKIIIGQFTLTTKLNLVTDDDDYSQTITFTQDELKKYKFKVKYISSIIDAFKNNNISFSKLSVSITDILNK